MQSFKEFLAKKRITPSVKSYLVDAMGAMALGLFGSLLIGTIFKAIGLIPGLGFMATIGSYASAASGPAMAMAIGYALKADPLVMYTLALVGYTANSVAGAGGPLAVLLFAIIACECGKLVSKTTKVDILVTPFVTLFVGGGLSVLLGGYIGTAVKYVADFISWATTQQPFLMGILVSVVVGIALTLPISSAAICAMIGLAAGSTGDAGLALAGGAAVAGCCTQMVGFAVSSFRENRWGGLVSQGLGTSMLQMPNIVRHPVIWLPTILCSAITGPLATCVFNMRMYGEAINSGMGTCGLLGPIGIVLGWYGGSYPDAVTAKDWIGLVLVCLLLPAVLTTLFTWILRRAGLIREGDMKLEL